MKINLERLVEQYDTMVSTIAHRMIQNKDVAKEASQEVWYEIIRSIDSFNGRSELSTWIYVIAKRTVLKYLQHEKIATIAELEAFRALSEIEYSGCEEDKKAWIKECCDWCLTALNHCLGKDARLIFIFKINIDLSYKQISEIMEMKEDNVRQISSRSINKITHFLNDTCPLYNPSGTCKCRICRQVLSIDLQKEYVSVNKIIRLVDLYQRLDKELPGKSYWEKFLT